MTPPFDTDVRELVERDIALLRSPGNGPSSPYRAMADRLESQLSHIARLQEALRDAWLSGFRYGSGLYSSSRLPSAEEDGLKKYMAALNRSTDNAG